MVKFSRPGVSGEIPIVLFRINFVFDDVKYEAEGSINYQVNQRNLNCPVRIKTVTPYPTNDKNHLEWFKCQQWMHADASEDLTNLQDICMIPPVLSQCQPFYTYADIFVFLNICLWTNIKFHFYLKD